MWLWFRLGSQVHYFCQLERQSKEDTARSSFCICHHWRCWSLGWQGVTPRHVLGSLRNDDRNGNDNDNAINQWYDWLNEENKSCRTCGTLFGAIFWRSLPNDDMKLSYLRFSRRKSAAVNLSFSAFTGKQFVPSKRKCISPILYNVTNRERSQSTQPNAKFYFNGTISLQQSW